MKILMSIFCLIVGLALLFNSSRPIQYGSSPGPDPIDFLLGLGFLAGGGYFLWTAF